ncbi:MAG: hypothetical protein ACRDX9_17715 [Acidimicrobiia bacterium]
MEAKDQGKGPKDWKVVAAVATASALGLSGLALADSDDGSRTPDPINLEDVTPITEVTVAKTTSTTLADLGVQVDTLDSASSPFDAPARTTTIADSVASADPAPAPAPAPPADNSADSPAPPPPPAADDSADSGAGSVDGSANS